MKKRNLRRVALSTIYILAIGIFGASMYLIQRIFNNNKFPSTENMEYVDKEIVTDNEYIPVVVIENSILKPYTNEEVTINKTFYNYTDEIEKQEKSIITYENTYIQNSGVDYTLNTQFDIVSILDGTVIEVTNNEILGKTIKIRHNNDIISTYQSLSDINVKVDDTVIRGQIIGKSGTCNLYPENSNLHFELSHQGKYIDPEQSYNKGEDEL